MAGETIESRVLEVLAGAMGEEVGRLLEDPEVTDVMKNDDGCIWVKKLGESTHIDTGYIMEPETAKHVIFLVAALSGATCNYEKPRVSAELPGGNRFQGHLPPVVVTPTFAIRKHALLVFSLDDYVERGILTVRQKDRIIEAVYKCENIIIGGGTGSGKTTFANAILKEIANTEDRTLIIQDTRELKCLVKNKVEMCTSDYVSMDDLVEDALRCTPKRIVIGEVRNEAALAVIDAWGTGHPGGICTIHCNSARNALSRIERLIRRVSKDSQREDIGETVNLIVYIEEGREGRRIKEIAEVHGYNGTDYKLNIIK